MVAVAQREPAVLAEAIAALERRRRAEAGDLECRFAALEARVARIEAALRLERGGTSCSPEQAALVELLDRVRALEVQAARGGRHVRGG